MDNNIATQTNRQEILVPQSIDQAKNETPKHKWSWVKFFLGFFILEHIIILFTISTFLFMYIRTYKYSDFAVLNQKAITFTPKSTDMVFDEIEKDLLDVLPKSQDDQGWKKFSFKINESQINSFLQNLDLIYIDKIYVMLSGENTVLLWVSLDNFPQPLMLKADYTFDQVFGFEITTTNIQIGAIPLPIQWVTPLSYSLSNTLNNLVFSSPSDYQYEIVGVASKSEVLDITMRVTSDQYTKLHGYLLSESTKN